MTQQFLILYISLSVGLLFICAYQLRRGLKHRFKSEITRQFAANDWPSVSICIPARNEKHAMTACLERVLASDYPKMEVIVYDDSSVDDTSVLIRSFAQSGVRFVPGAGLPEGWLGKNHALEVMAQEASGKYVVFMDVDTYLSPHAISELIRYIVAQSLDMVSVIPTRSDGQRLSVIFGHLRYFFEIVLSTAHAPATSSSLWAIKSVVLKNDFHGFSGIKSSVAPESALASLLGPGRYDYVIGSKPLGVSYEKKWRSQLATSRRLLYPRFGASFVRACAAMLFMLVAASAPWLALSGIGGGFGYMQVAAGILSLAFALLYGAYTSCMWTKGWWLGTVVWPVVITQELILLVASIIGYRRNKITWKGRPVTAQPISAAAYAIEK